MFSFMQVHVHWVNLHYEKSCPLQLVISNLKMSFRTSYELQISFKGHYLYEMNEK
jgi:hypothetical protein